MSYLRITPDEYRTIAHICRQQQLGGRHLPAFKRQLVESLAEAAPKLGERIARLRRAQMVLLYDHFQDRAGPPPTRHDFDAEELRILVEACLTPPFCVRFVRPFKAVLVEMLEAAWPDLSRKLAQVSGYQFERLFEEACRQQRGSA